MMAKRNLRRRPRDGRKCIEWEPSMGMNPFVHGCSVNYTLFFALWQLELFSTSGQDCGDILFFPLFFAFGSQAF